MGKFSVAFQSRLGRDSWLQPTVAGELVRLAEAGARKLLVICPSFVADCLETLEEIGQAGRSTFLGAGGESFTLIPALNDQPHWTTALKKLIDSELASQDPLPS
jgi:ferrochelatase